MKKSLKFFTIVCIILAGIEHVSCDNNKCDGILTGKLVILEEPYKTQNWCNKKYYNIVAHFYVGDNIPDSFSIEDTVSMYSYFKICGPIPKKFQRAGVQTVAVSLKPYHSCFHTQEAIVPLGADPNGEWYFYRLSCVDIIK
ncbi:MAG: hypothetical protein IKU03_03850 [Bacteroidales bacterium]|nr:hypothetical protein [Bacteroidales bacterium]